MAAENTARSATARGSARSFNEAAAHGRGKRPAFDFRPGTGAASMRPRRMAAENGQLEEDVRRDARGFNEAAAHGRGKRGVAGATGVNITALQ